MIIQSSGKKSGPRQDVVAKLDPIYGAEIGFQGFLGRAQAKPMCREELVALQDWFTGPEPDILMTMLPAYGDEAYVAAQTERDRLRLVKAEETKAKAKADARPGSTIKLTRGAEPKPEATIEDE